MAAQIAFFIVAAALLLIHTHAEAPGFSYSGDTGPGNWGSLNRNFTACSAGKAQSPIDIVKKKAVLSKSFKPLNRKYHPVNATLVNHGYNVGLQFGNAGELFLNGKNYTLQQMHWHTPSEHKFDGASSDAELHLVHKASDGSISVVAILYKIGRADPIIAQIQGNLAQLAREKRAPRYGDIQIPVGTFDARKLRRRLRHYYRYVGSLTTPPCSEKVIWHVSGEVRSISKEQVEILRAPLQSTCKSNCRPVQPLNGRRVELFDSQSIVN